MEESERGKRYLIILWGRGGGVIHQIHLTPSICTPSHIISPLTTYLLPPHPPTPANTAYSPSAHTLLPHFLLALFHARIRTHTALSLLLLLPLSHYLPHTAPAHLPPFPSLHATCHTTHAPARFPTRTHQPPRLPGATTDADRYVGGHHGMF